MTKLASFEHRNRIASAISSCAPGAPFVEERLQGRNARRNHLDMLHVIRRDVVIDPARIERDQNSVEHIDDMLKIAFFMRASRHRSSQVSPRSSRRRVCSLSLLFVIASPAVALCNRKRGAGRLISPWVKPKRRNEAKAAVLGQGWRFAATLRMRLPGTFTERRLFALYRHARGAHVSKQASFPR